MGSSNSIKFNPNVSTAQFKIQPGNDGGSKPQTTTEARPSAASTSSPAAQPSSSSNAPPAWQRLLGQDTFDDGGQARLHAAHGAHSHPRAQSADGLAANAPGGVPAHTVGGVNTVDGGNTVGGVNAPDGVPAHTVGGVNASGDSSVTDAIQNAENTLATALGIDPTDLQNSIAASLGDGADGRRGAIKDLVMGVLQNAFSQLDGLQLSLSAESMLAMAGIGTDHGNPGAADGGDGAASGDAAGGDAAGNVDGSGGADSAAAANGTDPYAVWATSSLNKMANPASFLSNGLEQTDPEVGLAKNAQDQEI